MKSNNLAKSKYGLETGLLGNVLRAAKKSKDPHSIATAYGILVDKVGKTHGALLAEIKKAAKELLKQIERAAGESNDPGRIGFAFGVIVDKKAFGEERKPEKEIKVTAKQRKNQYKELLNPKTKRKRTATS